MAQLTPQKVTLAGVAPTFVAAAGGGDNFANDGSTTMLYVKNGGGGAVTVTVDDTQSQSPTGAKSFDADVDVVVGAGAEQVIGPFPKARFTGDVAVSYSGVTSVTVAVLKL